MPARFKVTKILTCAALIGIIFSLHPIKAVDGLVNAQDIVNHKGLGSFAQHTIRFGLPSISPKLEATDYIFIDMPYFNGLSEPSFISGEYSGNPSYLVLGTKVRITGIEMEPGSSIAINGLSAYNPQEENRFDVFIRISSDPSCLTFRNESHVIATINKGSITISARIEADISTLRISGLAAPGMFVTFIAEGATIGTTVADEAGHFNQFFPGIPPVLYNITIFGVDSLNRITPSVEVEILARPYEITTVSGIVLPPTISIDKQQIERGENITVSGRGAPGYRAIVFTESPLRSYEVAVDNLGDYSYTVVDTDSYELGDYRAYSMIQDLTGSQSYMSFSAFFQVVGDTPPEDPGGTECDASHGDLNCDESVDLLDFSILIFYWGSRSASADINSDGEVNLLDFSIMMFYWQG